MKAYEKWRYINVDNEEIVISKGYNGWKEIHPIRNKDKTINWKNLIAGGSWWNLFLIIIFVLIALGFIYEYHNNLQMCSEVMSEINNRSAFLNQPINISPIEESLRLNPNWTRFYEAQNNSP